ELINNMPVTPATLHPPGKPLMKNFDPFYNDLPKTEIHIHLEGSIRTQTIIDVARELNLALTQKLCLSYSRNHRTPYTRILSSHQSLTVFTMS
ncbi:MAG: hypothetical protein ACM3XO_26880, partial [Bacteroidota bacterium]